MNKTTWNKGAPPSIGWWPAGNNKSKHEIRWWDGEIWSYACYPTYSAKQAGTNAINKNGTFSPYFTWSKRWWR